MKSIWNRQTLVGLVATGLLTLVSVPSASAQNVLGYWRGEGTIGDTVLSIPSDVVPAGATAAQVTAVLVDQGDGSLTGGTNTQVAAALAVQYSADVPGNMIFDPLTNTTYANTSSVLLDQAGRPFSNENEEWSDDASFSVNAQEAGGDPTIFKTRNFTYEAFIKSVDTLPFARIASIRKGVGNGTYMPGGSPVTAWSIGPFGTPGSQTYGIRADSKEFPYFLPGDGNGLANDAGVSFVPVNDSEWHHIAFTYTDGERGTTPGEFRFYVDGELENLFVGDEVSTESFKMSNNGTMLYGDSSTDSPDDAAFAIIGMADNIFGASLDGLFDEVRYTDSVLLPSQFLQLAGVTGPNGDFNSSGLVDGQDFLDWQQGFGITGTATLANGDGNADLNVDATDLAIWDAQYGSTAAVVSGAAVPEPTSISLAIVLAAMLIGTARTTRQTA
ncbi:LamG domain-containing protein [Adhaeretor mobilis]|uniref:LamG-like jellyroll fold domain-containing protein n=1 Tax=Adhaeretor mobilis TaxID=1930276 RepID=A0A517MZQ0_9BACT|nr:LamG domain-containing protein [Adhaeretor mobilis]QDT00372.1 hypothetical protein HG15A2_37080 [Adhaeretor mobilis]